MSSATETTTTQPDTKNRGGAARVLGILLVIAAVIMLVAGGVAWGAVSGQLKAQNMTVPADASSNAGKQVAGPFTAWSMQEIIGKHADNTTDGLSYAELGDVVNAAKEEFGEDSPEAAADQSTRNTAQTASFLRSSLFTSVLAFGVSFLVLGLGVTTGITGFAALALSSSKPKKAVAGNGEKLR